MPFVIVAVSVLWMTGLFSEPIRKRLSVEAHFAREAMPADSRNTRCAFKVRTPWRIYVSYPLGEMYVDADVIVLQGALATNNPASRQAIRVLRGNTSAIVDLNGGPLFRKFRIESRPYAVTVYVPRKTADRAIELWSAHGWTVQARTPQDHGR